MSYYIVQHCYILQIHDWIPVCTETQVRIGGGCWNTQLSMSVVPRRSCFSSISIIPYRELWYFTTLALISSHFYEMMLSAAFAWCLLLSSNSKILQSCSGEGKKKKSKMQNWETLSSPIWHLIGEQFSNQMSDKIKEHILLHQLVEKKKLFFTHTFP